MLEIKVPSPGESVTEVTIETWLKKDGDQVQRDEALAEIQSDKAMLTLYAEAAGKLKIVVQAGQTIPVGAVVCTIDTAAAGATATVATTTQTDTKSESKTDTAQSTTNQASTIGSPAAEKLMREQGLQAASIQGSGRDGRITKDDVVQQGGKAQASTQTTQIAQPQKAETKTSTQPVLNGAARQATRTKMTQLRKTLAHRLVSVKNETAMLTTFNEVDMTAILELRKKYKETFKTQHEVNLGFMSFFAKACVEGLRHYPNVGAQIDGDELVSFNYVDMGIAVSTDRGLMVPVVRGVDSKGLADIEKEIGALAERARGGKITIDEMMGGTFTITNGGVFGSLMSTPILNPPQSAILGMHKTQERAVVVDGQIVIRPMMYLALSYDHRVIDGRESVSFLVKVKECLEDPMRLLLHV